MAQSTQSLDMGAGGNTVKATSVAATTGSFTVVQWIKPTSLGTVILFGHTNVWRCQFTGGGNPRFFDGTGDNTFSTLTIGTGAWSAIAFKVSGTTCKCFLRPSGGSESSESLTITAPSGSPTTFYAGDDIFGSFTITGKQDHIQVYASALADATISALLDGTGDPASSSPRLYWKLEEGTGTTTADSSGNSYTGTITGATWSTDVPSELAGAAAARRKRRALTGVGM